MTIYIPEWLLWLGAPAIVAVLGCAYLGGLFLWHARYDLW